MLTSTTSAYIARIIDGEGSITLTRMHMSEHRRPIISFPSTDLELLEYIQSLIGGYITSKKNYKPSVHKNFYVLTIKNKQSSMHILSCISPYLRIKQKRIRAVFILDHYNSVTCRNGKYSNENSF
ncbi:LAGLIDADG family homing endonuclease [Alkalihalophilus lindianensis]|uniref:LAGLIDADG family homing endonuclease n=1 Tax=Alkalihalophilus lindianensis TaxID=1630542 RepID=A0ABU3X976_9BACI|nr:LAGLIDADG family homing endonuclease [Alkalihalophilus lindianensis]MDV2684197.1 LAGLIDADG family homing endonuclease [Alkalihalophilus lindianensis]